MRIQRRFFVYLLFLTGAGLFGATLLYSPISQALSTIRWNPPSMTQTIVTGSSKTIPISFTASENISNVVVVVVPEIQPFVQTSLSTFANIVKGQKYNLNLVLSAAEKSRLGPFDGTVQLKSGSDPKKVYDKPLPVTITVEPPGLPPDPGEAGKETLEGIDSDGNGVRDDIQRYIVFTYQDSAKTRAALTDMAKNLQAVLVDANDSEKSYQHSMKDQSAFECLYFLQQNAYEISQRLLAEILNTEKRSRAYLLHDSQLRGRAFDIHLPSKSACSFNPDQLEN